MTKTTAIFKFLLFLCLPCEPGRARATKFTALVTSMLVLVAPSCHPGPVTHHVTFYPCCWMKAFMNTKRISVRRWTFSFWIFNYQLSVLLRRTRISSLSGPWLSGFLFGVMVYFAQQLPGGSKAVNPALNTDCRSMVPGCENRKKKEFIWCLLHWLHLPSLGAISFCSWVKPSRQMAAARGAVHLLTSAQILTLCVLQGIAFSTFLVREEKYI